jgi:molybdopterin converting factor small subunit
MRVTLKLYASLGQFLPEGEHGRRAVEVELEPGATVDTLIERFRLPRPLCHLVLLNGVFVPPQERDGRSCQEGDEVAIWPPVAGG